MVQDQPAEYELDIDSELVSYIRDGKCTIFIGSGFSSAVCNAPAWDVLANEVANRVYGSNFSNQWKSQNPIDIFQICLCKIDKKTLVKHVREIILKANLKPGPHHNLLAQLPLTEIYTTNYDTLIEQALEDNRQPFKVAVKGQEYSCDTSLLVCKLHGTLWYPAENSKASKPGDWKDIVLTSDDYFEIMAKDSIGLTCLKKNMIKSPCLFLGYSMTDLDFRYVHWYLRDKMGGNLPDMFASMPDVPELIEWSWQTRGVKLIRVSKDDPCGTLGIVSFMQKLVNLVQSPNFSTSQGCVTKDKAAEYGTDQDVMGLIEEICQDGWYDRNNALRTLAKTLEGTTGLTPSTISKILITIEFLGKPESRATRLHMLNVAIAGKNHPATREIDRQAFANIVNCLSEDSK